MLGPAKDLLTQDVACGVKLLACSVCTRGRKRLISWDEKYFEHDRSAGGDEFSGPFMGLMARPDGMRRLVLLEQR